MTRLCDPPLAIEVELDPAGAPARVSAGPLRGPLQPASRWIADADWWSRPIAREYWKAILNTDLLVELFHDLHEDAWYLERIYD
ncbi:MAG: hypothetical protein E6J29_11145 [Chloroflexi bacterium]|nr:MAG: hypothetical protein E6J29_11145 [Chloroflexota bacterium]TMD53548.1 MAG: hypothetical protein E6I85_08110 [Chloroflexota bacterium]